MTGLSLRSRLSLAFALLALVPLASVVPVAIRNLRRTLTQEIQARADAAVLSTRARVQQSCAELRRAVDELVESPTLEEVARRSRNGPPPAQAAQHAMQAHGLSVLAFLADDGRTLSSGHLPARYLDVDWGLRRTAETARGLCEVREVMVPQSEGLAEAPALVSGGRLDYGETRLWVVGGQVMDAPFAEQLAQLTGARVELLRGNELLTSAGEPLPSAVSRDLKLSSRLTVRLLLDTSAVKKAEQGLTRAFLLVAAVGLALAGVLGMVVAGRLTRPLEALTEGARAVAEGELDTRISVPASGEVAQLLLAFNQMTENLKSATAQKLAAERVAAWQEIARSLAHELKNPLTPIQMSLETLVAAGKSQHPRFRELFAESAQAMLEEVERLRRTVDAFSRFARLPKPVREPLELSELVRQVLSIHGAMPANVQLRTALTPGLGVQADRDQLTQVLVNLLGNAREALGETGGSIEVRTGTGGAEVWVEVSDSGPGVPPEQRERLFTPYFTTKAGGTGLGLAIAARIAQEHGGRLELDEAPPPGARFRMRIPAALQHA